MSVKCDKVINCICGEEVTYLNLRQNVTCKSCSSVYDASGNLISSRHNWNIKDYLNSFYKKKKSA